MKKKLLLYVLLIVLLFPCVIKAEENNILIAGNNVEETKEKDATTFYAGENVFLKTKINGINFAAGSKLTISSNQDYLFAAGETVELNGATTKDAFVAGNNVTVRDSNIRDLYIAGNNVNIVGNIERNVYAAGEQITINANIGNDVYAASQKILVGENAVINGTLYYPKNLKDDSENKSIEDVPEGKLIIDSRAEVKNKKASLPADSGKAKKTLLDKISSFLFRFISMLLIALVSLRCFKGLFKKLEKSDKDPSYILSTSFIGLLVLIALPILSIFVMLTGFGLGLGILALVFYIIMICLSIIPVAYYLGKWLLKGYIENDYLIMTVSLFVLYVVKLIPGIGSLLGFIILIFGLGLFFRLSKEYIEK